MDNEIVLLEQIGFTKAEAKVYLTLLQNGALSGYEASKLTGIPSSKIYNLLETMKDKGFILYTEYEKNNKYAAIPMKEVSDKIRKNTTEVLDDLTERLSIFPQKINLDNIWHIRQRENAFAKCREVIKNAKQEVLMQVWEEDLPEILNELTEAENRGLKTAVVIFSKNTAAKFPLKNYYNHAHLGMVDQKKEQFGSRFISIVSDEKEVVFGQIMSASLVEVIWSESHPIVMLASEYIRHDVYCDRYVQKYKKITDSEEEVKQIISYATDIFQ